MNEWATECATHIFPSKNWNSRTLKICSSPSFWMDGVFRAVRWVMRGFDAADSERTVRPESPTSPNVEIGPTAKNLRTQCSREDCEQGISHRSNLTLSKWGVWRLKAACTSCHTWAASCQWHLLRVGSASKLAVQTTTIFFFFRSLSPRELRLDICNVLCKRARFVGAKHVQTTSTRPRPACSTSRSKKVRGWSPRKNSGRLVELSLVGRHPPYWIVRYNNWLYQTVSTLQNKESARFTKQFVITQINWPAGVTLVETSDVETVSPPTNHICWSSCVPVMERKTWVKWRHKLGTNSLHGPSWRTRWPRTAKQENGRTREGTQCKKKRTQDWTKFHNCSYLGDTSQLPPYWTTREHRKQSDKHSNTRLEVACDWL